ncbi:hypothetical protein DA01_08750 [Dehalococcoides mccartyi]|uniref:Uncharacterized protein n=1 Tax=Dehalococcoides mccartyi TaxID=61435 RepID=A0A0V8LXP4_9CHLR|nr:hypothetical protein [Dehalococcoides mccartyi]KSV16169.1 hypothetical protein DA01_08750 [Dehalococcoides mccartyi]
MKLFGMQFGRDNSRTQDIHILTEDGRRVKASLDVLYGCVVSEEWEQAWVLRGADLWPDRNGKGSVLLVNERSLAPINFDGRPKRTKEQAIKLKDEIGAEACENGHFHRERQVKKETFANVLQVLIIGLFGTVCIVALIGAYASGNIHLPWGN